MFCKNKEIKIKEEDTTLMLSADKILSSAAKCVFKWGKGEKNARKLGSKDDLAEVSTGRM